MDTMSYSDFRSQLAATLDKVNENHTAVLVTRENGKPVVVMSLQDFNQIKASAGDVNKGLDILDKLDAHFKSP